MVLPDKLFVKMIETTALDQQIQNVGANILITNTMVAALMPLVIPTCAAPVPLPV